MPAVSENGNLGKALGKTDIFILHQKMQVKKLRMARKFDRHSLWFARVCSTTWALPQKSRTANQLHTRNLDRSYFAIVQPCQSRAGDLQLVRLVLP